MATKTTDYNETALSPSKSLFYVRPYRLRAEIPAYKFGGVTDFSYSAEYGTDTIASRGAGGSKNVTVRNGDDSFSVDFTNVEALSVEAEAILEDALNNDEYVEIWEVFSDVAADGVTIKDVEGKVVPTGWIRDTYYVGRIHKMDHSNNAGDSSMTSQWTLTCDNRPDKSWIEPIDIQEESATFYPNASLKAYTPTDIPDNTVRDVNADEFVPSENESQNVHYDTPSTTPGE
ncbi:hypothetical protein [Lactococcus allomyrinae]|uniref:Uncharacterized protein n=1 Tax=Lactococcus allomyrinae TaxID=2419773 RepID=A0A387BL22_9LACT|nr:hypothetical protein [Lactococcus allomyrinae]AYG01706.1 hypothetical protein D7I46_11965 [Lactococcus allomyrinae]